MPKSSAAVLLCTIAMALPAFSLHGQEASAAPSLSPDAAHDLLHELDDAVTSIYDKVAPAVVIIEADKKVSGGDQDQSFDFYFHSPESGEGSTPQQAPEPTVRSEGSGFIFRADGYIYTNCHVIEDSGRIEVKLRDNRHFIAKIVGVDEHTDIAVLKIDATNLPAVTFRDSDSVRVGQMCFAIGIPYNLDYSFCRGVVSAKGRGNLTSTATHPMYEDYIQTDAFINPGNSGGPLIDIDGRVMGMNTLINGVGRGLSFAIPSNMLNEVGPQLIATGHATHPWLGITVADADESPTGSPSSMGVLVETIEADAPAYKSDLRPQDIITTVDGVSISGAHDLQREILRKKVGQTVKLNVSRGTKSLEIAIVTEELPADLTPYANAHAARAKTHPSDSTNYGLEFSSIGPASSKGDSGVVVSGVVADSPAGRAGIQAGDILTAVDQKPVSDTGACLALLAAHRGTAGPVLFISRGGHKGSAVLDVDGSEQTTP